MDFFTVPTLTFGILYCFFIIGHDRRRILQNIISGAGNAGDSGGPVFRCFQSSDPDRNFECPGPRPERSSTSDWFASYGLCRAEEPSGAQCTALSAA
jgi:hypothetical protein